ncbi:MAG: hypothetical protein OXI66_11920 [Boseongicola sp.]|nr:hypothetical protein [Boseongicola sp.]
MPRFLQRPFRRARPCESRQRRRVTAPVGGGEQQEFIGQSERLVAAWAGEGVEMSGRVSGQHHHFSGLDGLRVPQSRICRMPFG